MSSRTHSCVHASGDACDASSKLRKVPLHFSLVRKICQNSARRRLRRSVKLFARRQQFRKRLFGRRKRRIVSGSGVFFPAKEKEREKVLIGGGGGEVSDSTITVNVIPYNFDFPLCRRIPNPKIFSPFFLPLPTRKIFLLSPPQNLMLDPFSFLPPPPLSHTRKV